MKKHVIAVVPIVLSVLRRLRRLLRSSAVQPATFCVVLLRSTPSATTAWSAGTPRTRPSTAARGHQAPREGHTVRAPRGRRKLTAYAERNAELRHRYAKEINTYSQRGVDPPEEWKTFVLADGPTEDFQAVTDYADVNCS